LSKRNPDVLGQWGRGKPRVLAKNWKDPVRWEKSVLGDLDIIPGEPDRFTPYHRPTVFPSLCDWLDEEVPVEWLARFLALIHDTPNLRWLLLSKRPENWRQRLELVARYLDKADIDAAKTGGLYVWAQNWLGNMGGRPGFRPPNVWVGTSVEDQTRADERIPALLRIPAVGLFLSVEPMLGEVNLYDSGAIRIAADDPTGRCRDVDWVIIGGESGHGARPCNVDWIRSLVRQCRVARVPAFVKQLGANPTGRWTAGPDKAGPGEGWPAGMKITHPKGGDPAEWPADLRVRELPIGLR
jgi:protein gp37